MEQDQRPALGAIVLAAGRASRMGHNKLLLKLGTSTVLQSVLEAVRECDLQDVVCVTGHRASEIAPLISGFRVVHNSEYESGLHSSIQAGLKALKPGLDGFFVFLADQPEVHRGTVRDLASAFSARGEYSLYAPVFNGERGHPVLISMKHKDEILRTSGGDRGCHYLFAKYPEAVRKIDALFELKDIDTLDDYRRLAGEPAHGS